MARLFSTYLTSRNYRHALLGGAAIIAGAAAQGAALAQGGAPADTKVYSIPPSEVGSALQTYSEQADVEIIYAEQDVEGKTTDGVDGAYSREAALEEIIGDADLSYEINDDGVVVIKSSFLDLKQASSRQPEVRVARASYADEAQDTDVIDGDVEDQPYDDKDDDAYSDVVIVTGTNIRGIAPDSSPVRSYTREDIQITGAATAQDFIQTLPQNFGGGSNESNRGLPNNGDAASNLGRGSSINLRGLGSGSTLVLINGRRIAPSSDLGDFVDISLIPASAIERVDVLTDGASSIYGADAVAGVVNFVLRDDYDGVEASMRYGSVTQGNLDEFRTGFTAGKSWDTGNAIVSYEFFSRTNLSAKDREFSQSAPLPNDLLPSQRRHSVLASAVQEITPRLELSADFGFSNRETNLDTTALGTDQFIFQDSRTETLNGSLGVSWQLSDTWFLDLSGTYSRIDLEREQQVGLNGTIVDSEILASDLLVSGDAFLLPGGAVKLAVGGHFRSEDFGAVRPSGTVLSEADRNVHAVYGEAFIPIIGPDNALPGVERFEINVSGRYSDFSDFGDTANPKIGALWAPTEDLRLRGSYSTSFNPPSLGRSGAIDRSAAAYPTALFNTLLGLDVPADSPIANVIGLTVNGTSNSLEAETSRAFTGGIDFEKDLGPHQVSLSTTYFDIRFENRIAATPIPGNRISFDAPNIAIDTPEAFPEGTIVFNPTVDQINDLIDTLDAPIISVLPGLDPFDAAFINFVSVRRNLALSFVRGFDFDAAYSFSTNQGVISFGVGGTYLNDFQQQAAPTSPAVENLNTQFNPVDLKLRGRAGYARNGFTANIFVNYTDSYQVDSTPNAAAIDSFTTVDLNLAYDTQNQFDRVALNNTLFRISIINLFDENPPLTLGAPVLGLFGFDATNASPLNRFVSFEITKKF